MKHAKFKRSTQSAFLRITENKAERRVFTQSDEGRELERLGLAVLEYPRNGNDRYSSGRPVSELTAERKAQREYFTSIERHELQPIDKPGEDVEFERPYGIDEKYKRLNDAITQQLARTGSDEFDEPIFMFPTIAPTGRTIKDKDMERRKDGAPLPDNGIRKQLPKSAYRAADVYTDFPLIRDFAVERCVNVPEYVRQLPLSVQIDFVKKAMGF